MPRGVALVVSVRKNPRDRSHSLRLADLESPSGTEMRMFSLSAVLPHIIITFPPRERGSTSDIRVKKAEARRRVFLPLCKSLSFRLRLVSRSALVLWRLWMDGWGWMGWAGRRAAASQPQQVYISILQADHVRAHVSENADASLAGRDGLCDGELELHADWTGCDTQATLCLGCFVGAGQRKVQRRDDAGFIYFWELL